MTLYLQIDDSNLSKYYQKIIDEKCNNNEDSGFDLFVPVDCTIKPDETQLIDFGVKAYCSNSPLTLYPRSSIYKTGLIQCNSVGVIDQGYRGNIKMPVRNVNQIFTVELLTIIRRILGSFYFIVLTSLLHYMFYSNRFISMSCYMFYLYQCYDLFSDFNNLILICNNVKIKNVHLTENQRICQLCRPDLKPFDNIIIVDSLPESERGEGGFGSTGR
jgi:dUTPase